MRDGFVAALRDRAHDDVDGLPGRRGRRSCRARSGSPTPCVLHRARDDEARALFERLLALAQRRRPARPRSTTRRAKRLLGNFPQAFTHVGLVNSAYNLSHRGPAASGIASRR